eukprot:4703114-Amphidinium_carterae.1
MPSTLLLSCTRYHHIASRLRAPLLSGCYWTTGRPPTIVARHGVPFPTSRRTAAPSEPLSPRSPLAGALDELRYIPQVCIPESPRLAHPCLKLL